MTKPEIERRLGSLEHAKTSGAVRTILRTILDSSASGPVAVEPVAFVTRSGWRIERTTGETATDFEARAVRAAPRIGHLIPSLIPEATA